MKNNIDILGDELLKTVHRICDKKLTIQKTWSLAEIAEAIAIGDDPDLEAALNGVGLFRDTKAAVEELAKFVEKNPPDPNCKKCFGRGHIGKNTKTGKYVPCTCCKKATK